MNEFTARCLEQRCPAHVLLLPLAGLFLVLSGLRRLAYRLGLLPVVHLPVPVIVVGNITAGGTGKTPLTLWLVGNLQQAGWRPGVVSRGHGGRQHGPMAVLADSDPVEVGDEPVLLARRAGVPVWVGRDRGAAARALLAAHPDVNLIVTDDGLQHYALARDIEIAVVDGVRRFGNGWPLPAGPLREMPGRLERVDAVVMHGGSANWLRTRSPVFAMRLQPTRLRGLRDGRLSMPLEGLVGRQVQAVAGIGHPERFFELLRGLGADVVPHPFPDHYRYRAGDLPAGLLVMTEKDAVKCAAFAPDPAWVLEVDAIVDTGLQTLILNQLVSSHGCEAA